MKVAFISLGFFCLIATLQALPLQDEVATINGFEHVIQSKIENLPEGEVFIYESSRPPQIHHNVYQGQAPYAGRLVNILKNQMGLQDTQQLNRIGYNLNRKSP